MFAVTIDLDAYENLPPRQLKAMLRALRFADPGGVVHASLTMLAMPGLSRSTAHREFAGLEDAGHVDRQERPEGGFLWRIGRRFRHVSKPRGLDRLPDVTGPIDRPPKSEMISAFALERRTSRGDCTPQSKKRRRSPVNGTPVPEAETPVPQRGTTDSRATPAVKNLSSGSKEPSERELSLGQDEIPVGWEEAAAAERRLAGLGEVNLPCEWRKLVAYAEGAQITIWRWRGWALKARGDHPSTDVRGDLRGSTRSTDATASTPSADGRASMPGDDRQQRQARDWVRRGFWLRDGSWGPAPDRPGCNLPPSLIAWCVRERQAAA